MQKGIRGRNGVSLKNDASWSRMDLIIGMQPTPFQDVDLMEIYKEHFPGLKITALHYTKPKSTLITKCRYDIQLYLDSVG